MAVGFPTKVSYANGDVFSASDINDTNSTLNLLTSTQTAAAKNAVINGGFDIWQRGTTSSGNAYIADRWYSALISGTGTFAQETTVIPSGGLYSMKFTASATAQPALYQAIEQLNTIPYAGKTVTVSALVAASTSVPMTIDVQHSSTADNSVTGSWTSITATSGGTATPTSTTFVSISGVYAIPSTAKSLRVRLFTTSTIANTVVVYFDNVQLELGSTVSTFSRAGGTIQGELAACQRYFYSVNYLVGTKAAYNVIANGRAVGTTSALLTVTLPVSMRVAPTSIAYGGNIAVDDGSTAPNLSALTINQGATNNTLLSATTTGVVANRPVIVYTNNDATAYVHLSAEL
jgi:hypothetical protein